MIRKLTLAASAALLLASVSTQGAKAADLIPYANIGTYNDTTYTFTAAHTGDIVAYFAGASAGYDNQLGLLVNGVAQGGFGLDDHSTPVGSSIDFGHVDAGDTLVFVLENLSVGQNAYSDPSMNLAYDDGPVTGSTDGHNHIYSTAYTGNPAISDIPQGTFVGFEDLAFPNSDYDYNDEQFVFTNVATSIGSGGEGGVPEPATWSLMILGVGAVGAMARRGSRKFLAVA